MPKYHFTGTEPENLAQVGRVNPGDVISLKTEIGDELIREDSRYKQVTEAEARKLEQAKTDAAAKALGDKATAAQEVADKAKADADEALKNAGGGKPPV